MTPGRLLSLGRWAALLRCPSPLAARARATLAWSGLAFLSLYLLGAYFVEKGPAKARDPEFAAKFERLQARLDEHPNQPLILMLGSSRTLLMLDAGSLHPDWNGTPAQVFNFGMKGSGPLLELLCLERLLKAGVRPNLLLLEVFPRALQSSAGSFARRSLVSGRPAEACRGGGVAALSQQHATHLATLAALSPEALGRARTNSGRLSRSLGPRSPGSSRRFRPQRDRSSRLGTALPHGHHRCATRVLSRYRQESVPFRHGSVRARGKCFCGAEFDSRYLQAD